MAAKAAFGQQRLSTLVLQMPSRSDFCDPHYYSLPHGHKSLTKRQADFRSMTGFVLLSRDSRRSCCSCRRTNDVVNDGICQSARIWGLSCTSRTLYMIGEQLPACISICWQEEVEFQVEVLFKTACTDSFAVNVYGRMPTSRTTGLTVFRHRVTPLSLLAGC